MFLTGVGQSGRAIIGFRRLELNHDMNRQTSDGKMTPLIAILLLWIAPEDIDTKPVKGAYGYQVRLQCGWNVVRYECDG